MVKIFVLQIENAWWVDKVLYCVLEPPPLHQDVRQSSEPHQRESDSLHHFPPPS